MRSVIVLATSLLYVNECIAARAPCHLPKYSATFGNITVVSLVGIDILSHMP